MEIKVGRPVLPHILTQPPERVAHGHLVARRVGHLVHPYQTLPVLPCSIIYRPPVPPVGGLFDVDDPPASGVIGVLRRPLDDPTPTLGQRQVGRRPGHSCPARGLIPKLHLLLLRPGDTGHLTRWNLPFVFDRTVVAGQLLGTWLA